MRKARSLSEGMGLHVLNWGEFDEVGGGQHSSARGKELRKETLVQIGIEIGAAVLDYCESVIGVTGLKKSGENDATGRDAEQDERLNIVGAENHGQVGTGEGAHTMLGDDDFAFRGRERRVDASQWLLKQTLMSQRRLHCAESLISGTHFRKTGAKTYFNVDDGHVRRACVIQDAGDARKKSVLISLGVDGDDACLAIHT